MSKVVRYPFEHRKCPPGSLAKCAGRGLVIIDAANGFERDIRYPELLDDGEYTEVVDTVDVRDLTEVPAPDPRLVAYLELEEPA
jgi:hypothetical protein